MGVTESLFGLGAQPVEILWIAAGRLSRERRS